MGTAVVSGRLVSGHMSGGLCAAYCWGVRLLLCEERGACLESMRETQMGSANVARGFGQNQRARSECRTVRTPIRTSLLCLLRLLLHRQGAAPWQRVLCFCSARTGDTNALCV